MTKTTRFFCWNMVKTEKKMDKTKLVNNYKKCLLKTKLGVS